MNKKSFLFSKFPGWLIMLLFISALYVTGLHKEVIGKIQGIFLHTQFIKPDLNNTFDSPSNPGEANLTRPSSLMAGKDFKMKSLTGETITMESLYGKTVFFNIWATWCPPCIAEMPNIQKLYDKVNSEEIVFLMLTVDSDKEKPGKFIERKGYTFPVYFPDGPIPYEFTSDVIPTTFIISPEGKVVVKKEGMANYNTKEFINFLKGMKP
jgi:thiol-disulfide isomerase/thioredoxin